jgi:hypothetical protein
MAHGDSTTCRNSGLRFAMRFGVAVLACSVLSIDAASAYVGDSFMQVPGLKGDWQGKTYGKWVRFDANYWNNASNNVFGRRRGSRSFFSGPMAPRQGENALVVSIDKHSPMLPKLMDMCAKKVAIPEVTYAESADRARSTTEVGPRPADMPAYFEYKLKDVTLSDCPVVADAPDQAFVVSFKNIEWLNYHAQGDGEPTTMAPAVLPAAQSSGKTMTYVLNWFGYAHDVSDDQCNEVTEKPTETDYYRYFSQEKAAAERIRLASKGGPTFPDGQMCLRGPDQLNVCRLPGIVPDPRQPEPNTKTARGINLDGDDGLGNPPRGTRKHRNFAAPDGRTGIDNQLYVVDGCMRGLRGHKGQLLQYANEQRKNGQLAILLQISGIDDLRNDDNVDVTLLYSLDPTAKNGDGTKVLSDYTFRITNNLEFAQTFKRWHGRIVDGVVVTDPVDVMSMVLPLDVNTTLYRAEMRLELRPDGSLQGVLGGYQDWRTIMTAYGHSLQESLFGSSVSAMYNALKRNADGLRDPVTGEFNGISSAYDIEGVPAFTTAQSQARIAQSEASPRPEAQAGARMQSNK